MYLSLTPSPPHSSSCGQNLQLRIISFRTLCGQRHRSCTAMVMRSSVWPAVQTEDTLHLLARSTFHSIPEWHITHVLFPFYSTIPFLFHCLPFCSTPILFHAPTPILFHAPTPILFHAPTPILFHRPHLPPFLISLFQASKPEHASIRVWSTDTWRQVTLLTHHTLTVTQLAFSHSGTHLLAVSRDRGWSLWKHTNKENGIYINIMLSFSVCNRDIRKHPAYYNFVRNHPAYYNFVLFSVCNRDIRKHPAYYNFVRNHSAYYNFVLFSVCNRDIRNCILQLCAVFSLQ